METTLSPRSLNSVRSNQPTQTALTKETQKASSQTTDFIVVRDTRVEGVDCQLQIRPATAPSVPRIVPRHFHVALIPG